MTDNTLISGFCYLVNEGKDAGTVIFAHDDDGAILKAFCQPSLAKKTFEEIQRHFASGSVTKYEKLSGRKQTSIHTFATELASKGGWTTEIDPSGLSFADNRKKLLIKFWKVVQN